MCAALAMASQMLDTRSETFEKVLLEWLPWSHVAGGTAIFNSVLNEGLSLYLDDGRPVPGMFEQTLRNLREVSPFRLGNMPLGYAMLLQALDQDEALGRSLFRHLRRLASMGARLPDSVYNGIQAHAVRHTGCRIPFTAAYGSTETTAAVSCVYWHTERADLVGLPHPGVEMKLVPTGDGRYDVRVRSPTVLSGYLQQPQLTAQAFDEEGYFCMGDAVSFVDQEDPLQGLAFAGRTAEEFKLSSGVFVRVGTLRVDLISALAPWVADAVITGADQAEVGAMVWLNMPACRQCLGLPDASPAEILAAPALRQALHKGIVSHNLQHPGSSMRVRRLVVLDEPPSMDAGEINDKGYVNQRRVLERRSPWVARLHAPADDGAVMRFD
jgi:feruloyl-CoA synthase